MTPRIDIVLFGASGFTGWHCIESLFRVTKANGLALTWGIAGRSEQKLKDALQESADKIGENLSSVPIIVADISNPESIKQMTARCRILISCCGPFRFYGEPVVKACVETGTNIVDVSGEPQFLETIQYKYHKAAQEKGIYIVSACGFDSVPADLGVLYLQEKFEGTVNSVETYLQLIGKGKPAINYATYESAVYGLGAAKELRGLRQKLYPNPLPNFKPKLKARPSVHKSNVLNKWCIPFMGSDRSVVQRTQRYLFDQKKSRPAQIHTYLGLSSTSVMLGFIVVGAIIAFLARFKFGRNLLLKYPSIFTAGMVSHTSPKKSQTNETRFEMMFIVQGWKEKLTEVADQFTIAPNKKMVGRLSGRNPGYGLTSALVSLAAVVVLTEADRLPKGGGVYTPGIAFKDTSYRKLIQENGLKFEILNQ